MAKGATFNVTTSTHNLYDLKIDVKLDRTWVAQHAGKGSNNS